MKIDDVEWRWKTPKEEIEMGSHPKMKGERMMGYILEVNNAKLLQKSLSQLYIIPEIIVRMKRSRNGNVSE